MVNMSVFMQKLSLRQICINAMDENMFPKKDVLLTTLYEYRQACHSGNEQWIHDNTDNMAGMMKWNCNSRNKRLILFYAGKMGSHNRKLLKRNSL